MKCPAQVYQKSARSYGGTPADLDYPGMDCRRVNQVGKIKWQGTSLFLTTSLAGWSVGLKTQADGRLEAYFGRLLLGWLDPATESFQRAELRPLEAGQTETHV
jgi:hypothetical protein